MSRIVIGIIRGSHGLKGHFKVESMSGQIEHFFHLEEVFLRKNEKESVFKVEEVKKHNKYILIKLQGIESPEKGQQFFHSEIWSDRENASKLCPGEYYMADLYECSVCNIEGKKIAKIITLYDTGYVPYLEIETLGGKKVLIPFQEEFIGEINMRKKEIVLKTQWLLE